MKPYPDSWLPAMFGVLLLPSIGACQRVKPLDSKLPNVGTTIFTLMSQLAELHRAVNLSQGFPDFRPPPVLLELVDRCLSERYHQYALMPGSMPLRTAIATKLAAMYDVAADPVTEITVTSGATEAIFDAIQAVVRRDDEVIVFDPCYDSYEPSITLAGGRAIHLPLTQPDFGVDWERLRAAFGSDPLASFEGPRVRGPQPPHPARPDLCGTADRAHPGPARPA